MKLLFPYFIILLVLIQLNLRKNSKKEKDSIKAFWERERKANSVRRKSIDNLNYITIPDSLPLESLDAMDTDILKARDAIVALKGKKILNLTGFSNTDIKMEYGVANLTQLSEYDENYSTLIRNIAVLGRLLLDRGYTDEGIAILEFGIKCKSDVSANYTLLADYYKDKGEDSKIKKLIDTASKLKSMNKDLILKKLQD